MTSRKSLKLDLKLLKDTFSKEHERFQVSQAATDQLTCRFIGENGKKYDIHANIPVRVRFLVDLVFVVCHFSQRLLTLWFWEMFAVKTHFDTTHKNQMWKAIDSICRGINWMYRFVHFFLFPQHLGWLSIGIDTLVHGQWRSKNWTNCRKFKFSGKR